MSAFIKNIFKAINEIFREFVSGGYKCKYFTNNVADHDTGKDVIH